MRTRKPAFLSAFALVALLQACTAHAAPPAFNGPDFSGTYDCTGQDHHEGPYTGTVTLERVADQSTGAHGAYTFSLDVPGYGIYRGHAASRGRQMAIHFALPDQSTRDYGTGIAHFERSSSGQWRFRKFYYEPEFKDGNHGFEDCLRRK